MIALTFMPPTYFHTTHLYLWPKESNLCKRVCIDQAGAVIYVCLTYAVPSSKKEPGDAHLFDPGSDAMSEPQLSGCFLTGAQNMTNLPV